MFVCLKKHLPRPLVETGPCNHLASFGKPEKKQRPPAWPPKYLGSNTYLWPKCVRSWLGGLFGNQPMTRFARSLFACSEFVPSSPGVRPEFARSLFGVRSEFFRSFFGLRSEFVRGLFGVCSELVRSWFTGNLGPQRSAPYYVVCGPNPKNCPCRICCRSMLSL